MQKPVKKKLKCGEKKSKPGIRREKNRTKINLKNKRDREKYKSKTKTILFCKKN